MEQRKMSKEEEINDSLEVCRDIYIYYKRRESTGTDGQEASYSSLYAAAYAAKKEPYKQAVPIQRETPAKETKAEKRSRRIQRMERENEQNDSVRNVEKFAKPKGKELSEENAEREDSKKKTSLKKALSKEASSKESLLEESLLKESLLKESLLKESLLEEKTVQEALLEEGVVQQKQKPLQEKKKELKQEQEQQQTQQKQEQKQKRKQKQEQERKQKKESKIRSFAGFLIEEEPEELEELEEPEETQLEEAPSKEAPSKEVLLQPEREQQTFKPEDIKQEKLRQEKVKHEEIGQEEQEQRPKIKQKKKIKPEQEESQEKPKNVEIKTKTRQKRQNWFKLELDPDPDFPEQSPEGEQKKAEKEEPEAAEEPVTEDLLPDEPEKVSSILRNILSLFLCVLIAFVSARVLNQFIVQPTQVEGISMEDTLHNGEHLLMDKLSYRFHDPERFDIIIFPFEEGVYYIKRIIGLPGETIQILDGQVYVNGELLAEDVYGNTLIQNAGRAGEEVSLGKDEYFVLGDNRNNSFDSRYEVVGNIHREQLLGKAFFRIYPFSKFGSLSFGKEKEEEIRKKKKK